MLPANTFQVFYGLWKYQFRFGGQPANAAQQRGIRMHQEAPMGKGGAPICKGMRTTVSNLRRLERHNRIEAGLRPKNCLINDEDDDKADPVLLARLTNGGTKLIGGRPDNVSPFSRVFRAPGPVFQTDGMNGEKVDEKGAGYVLQRDRKGQTIRVYRGLDHATAKALVKRTAYETKRQQPAA
jgi:hypothetical protein